MSALDGVESPGAPHGLREVPPGADEALLWLEHGGVLTAGWVERSYAGVKRAPGLVPDQLVDPHLLLDAPRPLPHDLGEPFVPRGRLRCSVQRRQGVAAAPKASSRADDAAAIDEWAASDDASAWDALAGDGLGPDAPG